MADELKELIEEKAEETKRHFDVVAERIEGKIDTLLEKRVAILESKEK